jgi:lysophospholipase L1-like esterase
MASISKARGNTGKRRILVFGDSNAWGFVPRAGVDPTTRYDASTRWPGAMAAQLGEGFEVVEEALSARTTDLDDTQIDVPSVHLKGATLNGAKVLPAILSSHLPLDLVIIMLGTNDLKARFRRRPDDIAQAAVGLARLVKECEGGIFTVYPAPKVLLIAPPPLGTKFQDPEQWAGSREKSLRLGAAMKNAATSVNLAFFDAGEVITTDGIDSVHLTADAHCRLGKAVANQVRLALRGMKQL